MTAGPNEVLLGEILVISLVPLSEEIRAIERLNGVAVGNSLNLADYEGRGDVGGFAKRLLGSPDPSTREPPPILPLVVDPVAERGVLKAFFIFFPPGINAGNLLPPVSRSRSESGGTEPMPPQLIRSRSRRARA
jgi:hypothetical protein